MRNISAPALSALVLLVVLGLQAALLLLPSALAINGHEGDLLHVLDASQRLALGEWPHTGFMTPLGVLSFAPISAFMAAGYGPGLSIRLGFVLVAAVMLPLIWYVGQSRLGPRSRLFFGAWIVVMVTALVHGGDQATSSVSMYYNRWAWALVFLCVTMILVPPSGAIRRPVVDGAVIGLMLALMALIKVTSFVAVVPAVVVWLVLSRDLRAALAIAGSGLAVAVLVTFLAGGPGYWLAYARDLLFLAQDSARAKPGLDFLAIVANPAYLPGSVCLFLSVIVLRMSAHREQGLLLLILAPGFIYITYQNWGNDPTWLLLLAFMLLALRPAEGQAGLFGVDVRRWHDGLALVALALTATSVVNITYSTTRSAMLDRSDLIALFDDGPASDLMVSREREDRLKGLVPRPPIAPDAAVQPDVPEPIVFAGETLEECAAQTGLIGVYRRLAQDMRDQGRQDQAIVVADVVNPLWLFGGGKRIAGMAPWYYGGISGLDAADFVIVPTCPFKADSRNAMVVALDGMGAQFALEARDPHYLLFRRISR